MTNWMTDEPLPQGRPLKGLVRPVDLDLSEATLERRFLRTPRKPQKVAYEFTQDPGLLHQYFRLREDMFISVWGLKHFDGKHETFDDVSQILVARKGLQCIAGGRLTVSSQTDHQRLPMEEKNFLLKDLVPELKLEDRTYGEFSRLAILPDFRGGAVFPEIASRFIKKAIDMGVDYAFNIAPLPLARSYRQAVQLFGLRWELRNDIAVPDHDEYEGIRMVLSVMDLTRFKPARNGKLRRETALAD